MQKKTLKKLFSVILSFVIVSCIFIYVFIQFTNFVKQRKILNQANKLINENIINSETNSNNDENIIGNINQEEGNITGDECNNVIGKVKINKINVDAPITDGTNQDILKYSVGHFKNTSYWNGNVALAAHNRGSYAHYFEKLNKLNIGDEIQYQTKLGTRIYYVKEINKISEDNVSVLENTKENTITLITCVKGNEGLRLCVKGVEKNM